MLKKNCFVLMFIGILLISLGFFLFSFYKKEDYLVFIDTSKVSGDNIDNSSYKYYESNNSYNNYTLKTQKWNVKNLYKFLYSNTLEPLIVNDTEAFLASNDSNIRVNIVYNTDIYSYKKNLILYYKNNFNFKVSVSDIKELNFYNNDAFYFKIQAFNDNSENADNNYIENFIFAYIEDDESMMVFSYSIIDKKFSDEFLSNFVNNITVEKGKANYLYSNIQDGYINGKLIATTYIFDSIKATLSYKIDSNNFYEVEDYRNSLSSTTFKKKDNFNFLINISLSEIVDQDSFFDEYVNELKSDNSSIEQVEFLISKASYFNNEYYIVNYNYFDKNDNKFKYQVHLLNFFDNHLLYLVVCNSDSIIEENSFLEFLAFEFDTVML